MGKLLNILLFLVVRKKMHVPCISCYKVGSHAYSASFESEGIWYIFGGMSEIDPVNDIVAIDLETYECKTLAKKGYWPPPISSHTAVIDEEEKKVYIYGGCEKYVATSNVYEYNIETNNWVKVDTAEPGPLPRSSHGCAINQESMFVFGGISNDGG